MSVVTREQLVEAAAVVKDLQDSVSAKKYQLAGEDSFKDGVLKRVVAEYKKRSSKYVDSGLISDNAIEDLIMSGKFIPAGSILSGLGNTSKCSLSNCYVTPIKRDSIEHIFDNLKQCARTYSYRGGTGVDVTVLRPQGCLVNNAARSSSGAVSFMPLLSEVTNAIGQQGRRGALLVSIDIRHPDAMRFIWCKSDPERVFGKDPLTGKVPDIFGANISLKLTDAFMEAASSGQPWEFVFPDRDADPELYDSEWDGDYDRWASLQGAIKSYGTMPAADILSDIAKAAHTTGDPGVLFIDTVATLTPGTSIHLSLKPISTNPCFSGEMRLRTANGDAKFKDLAGKEVTVLTPAGYPSDGAVWSSGVKETVRVTFKVRGRKQEIICTPDHVFLLWGGLQCEAQDLEGEQLTYVPDGAKEASPVRVLSVEPNGEIEVFDFSEPMHHWGVVEGIVAHNCGEQPIGPYNNCLLGSMVMSKYVAHPFTTEADFDSMQWAVDVKKAVQFMNVMSDINQDRHPLQEQRDADAFGKRIGVEFTALGDTLAMLGLRYGEEESLSFVEDILRQKALAELSMSMLIAKAHGACPALADIKAREAFLGNAYVRGLRLAKALREDIRAYGLANTAFNTVGPTGSISIMSNNCSSGIEPLFMFAYTRQTRLDPGKMFNMMHKPAVDFLLAHWGPEYEGHTAAGLKEMLGYVEAWEVPYNDRIRMQAAVQRNTDSSISSTVNLPSDASPDTIEDIYVTAWENNLKGITVFRDGCKTGVLTATEKPKEAAPQAAPAPAPGVMVKELLDEERAMRFRVHWKGAKIYVIVTLDDDDTPLEVFAKLPREVGNNADGFYSEEHFQEKYSLWESVTRLISLLLRSGMPLDKILKQLERSSYSVVDAAAILIRILRKFVPNELEDFEDEEIVAKGLGELCKECGQYAYVRENGCGSCRNCGYTSCG